MRIPDPDMTRSSGVYLPHLPRMDGMSHHALMSPPATNSSGSEGNSEDECYSDEDGDAYPMDIDNFPVGVRREAESDEGMVIARDGPAGPQAYAPSSISHPTPSLPMKGSSGSSSSSDVSVWSRPASPARGPAGVSEYGHHVQGSQLHRHAHANSNAHSPRDQQGRNTPHSHGHGHGQTSEYIYRPSIAAYAISCTDSRVSTALRPAFTSSSSCNGRDRDRDRYRSMNGSGRERDKRHSQGYPSRG